MLWNSIVKNSKKNSMFNCNQNYHRYKKYYVLIMASKTWYPKK
jgi:hypothetical protein